MLYQKSWDTEISLNNGLLQINHLGFQNKAQGKGKQKGQLVLMTEII